MGAYCFSRRGKVRQILALATLAGIVLLVATATLRAADDKTARDRNAATAKDTKTPQPPEAGPADDFGPPGPPQDDGQRRPGPRRQEGRRGDRDARQPGPPPGPDGSPNRPDSFGPGQPPGAQSRGPRPDWPAMERNDPEMNKLIKAENELNRRTEELARNYRDAPKEQRAKLKEDLKKLVAEQFGTRQQRRKLELTRFEEELKRLRDAADRREKNQQQMIEKRVSDLLGEEPEAGF